MNKKLLAAAVASTLAAPTVASADVSWYGSIRTGLTITDTDDDTTADIGDYTSRFGVNASEDLGNGLEAFARYEFRVNSDKGNLSSASAGETQRLSYVGLRSDTFGSFSVGSQWSTFFDHVGTLMDPSLSLGGWAYFGGNASQSGTYRLADSAKWTNDFGALSLGLMAQLDGADTGSDGVDRFQLGGTFGGGGPISVAFAYDDVQGTAGNPAGALVDRDTVGAGVRWAGDGFWVNAAFTQMDDDTDDETTGVAIIVGGRANSLGWFAGVENLEDDDLGVDDDVLIGNLTHHMSDRTQVVFEIRDISADVSAEDQTVGLLALRHNF